MTEFEAVLQSVQEMFHCYKLMIWIKLNNKLLGHRFCQKIKTLNLNKKTWISPLYKIVLKFKKLDLLKIEQIYLYTKAL